ncbi:uncharacterized protein [Spinacia oleracea]|uniref:TTF-type domain-containing protein n=1 Tax=Spinacia oleracea TaxID=3562 RepID=A0ABM3QPW7_SPIOL|nr:uncharacterized protein LOC110798425 [Spinacia oleracea]
MVHKRTAPTRERVNQFDIISLSYDLGLRKRISDYHPDDQDAVRRAYIQRIVRDHNFQQIFVGGGMRRFNPDWYDAYKTWLEYSIAKEAVFCFICYLFRDDIGAMDGDGHDTFVSKSFKGWNRPHAFSKHVGAINSVHNRCMEKYNALIDPQASIQNVLSLVTPQARKDYRTRLIASLDCLRYLLLRGMAISGHDESENSFNQGNFREFLKWYAKREKKVAKVVLKNAPGNNQMISPLIQKDIAYSCSKETIRVIMEELGDDYFGILVDESRDVSCKEQAAFCLRYDTTALSLRGAIYSIFAEYALTPTKIRGQGYDGANNMKGDSNGLKTLIMNETKYAYYIHCFAHQLQLTLVAVSKNNVDRGWLFELLSTMLYVVGGSCKRQEILNESQTRLVAKEFQDGEIESGKGLNQQLGLGRPGDTRWGSDYKLLLNVIVLNSAICEVQDMIFENPPNSDDRAKADRVGVVLVSFDFIFMVHLMKTIFGVENKLNIALQKKYQDIVNAVSLVKLTKERLQQMREDGWESLLTSLISFCDKRGIGVPNMDEEYAPLGRKKRGNQHVTNLYHFRVQDELDNFIHDMQRDGRFEGLKDIGELSKKLVETTKHDTYRLIYLLIKMVLIFQWQLQL